MEYYMIILVLLNLVSAFDPEDRLLNCYLVAQAVANNMRKEIVLHVQANPPILSLEVKLKATEDGFTNCVAKATQEDIENIGKATRLELNNFAGLLDLNISRYLSPEDVFVGHEFRDKTIEYTSKLVRRISQQKADI